METPTNQGGDRSLMLDPELSIEEMFPDVAGNEEGLSDTEKELKATFDRQISELTDKFNKFSATPQAQPAQPAQPDPETTRLANLARTMMNDPELRPLLERKSKGESINTPAPDDGTPQASAFEKYLEKLEQAIPEESRYNEGQRLSTVAMLREPLKQFMDEMIAPLKAELDTYKQALAEQVKPINERLTAIGNRTSEEAWRQGFGAFVGEYGEATDPRIADKLVPLVRNDPRFNTALQQGNAQAIAKIFKQNLLSDLSGELETIRKEAASKKEVEQNAQNIESGINNLSLDGTTLPPPNDVLGAVELAYKQLGLSA